MRWLPVVLVAVCFGCDSVITAPPKPPPPIDSCEGLSPMTAAVVPDTIRVNGAATISATGGSGRYTYVITNALPAGSLSGNRYVAGLALGTDTLTASDDCGNFAAVSVEVTAAFEVQPERAAVPPSTSFQIRVTGARGAPTFTPQGGSLLSAGTLTSTGLYTSGMGAGTDVVLVRDSLTGDQAAVVINVSPSATFRVATARLALPAGTFIPLETLDGTGVVQWSIKSMPAVGTIEQRTTGPVYVAPGNASGTIELEAHDELLNTSVSVKVRVLSELLRPGLVAQGRRSDVATLVKGDFDGDGIEDVALGVPESDVSRPQGGAVFIFKGSAAGFPDAPTWFIPGTSDTAQFGAVMAAGDLDGDGHDDLAISAPGDDLTVADSGAVYLYRIGANGPVQIRSPLTGLGRGNFGAALAIADVDADGNKDLIIGSPGADIAPGGAFSARGVIDVFLLVKGQPIPDLGSIRLSGYDLDADAGVRRFSNLRAGRAIVASDLNGDSVVDLAFLSSVNNSIAADGGNLSRSVIAVQVHLGRSSGPRRFEDTPDSYVLPANIADGDEGTWRLGFIPAAQGRPSLLVAAADRADSPDLRANDAGVQSGSNSGGALLFDLSVLQPASVPTQVTRLGAWARVYADQGGIQAGRSFDVLDADGDGAQELVLGAPYAAKVDAGVTYNNAGRLEFFSLARLTGGAVVNRPDFSLNGTSRTDVLGTAVLGWRSSVVAFNGRASTALGDFTGRLDVFTAGNADPASWPVKSIAAESRPAALQLGVGIEVGAMGGVLQAVVGMPGWNGTASDFSGNEVGAGQALVWKSPMLDAPRLLAEGANTAYVTDAGVRAFGGRTLGADVAMTDFDGDGRLDLAIAAPNFSPPAKLSDGGVNSTEYALNRPECAPSGAQSPGGVLVHLGQADGTFKEGFRLWALRDIPGCVVPDGGSATICQRSAISRNGLVGGFDFDGDGKKDLGAIRSNGLEIFSGRVPDDAQLAKPSMGCDPAFTLPFVPQTTSMPAALGDLNGDGCDEIGLRYSDANNRQGVIIAFGFDPSGVRCGAVSQASWVRISGDTETGVPTMRLGVSLTRARDVLMDGTDSIAITADLYPFGGVTQPTVLLVPTAQVVAKRPVSGEQLVSILGDGLVAVPLVPFNRALGFGRVVMGDVDVDGDAKRDLVVSAPGANVNGDGTGAVFVFKGGTVTSGANRPSLIIVADHRERGAFGQDLSLSPVSGSVSAALGIGAPLSYRTGTANGTAFILPMDF